MALISCGECGHKVSSTATNCPSCGAPVAGKSSTHIENKDSLIVLGACVLGIFTGVFASSVAARINEDNLGLRASVGFVGLIAPPIAALVYTSRRKR